MKINKYTLLSIILFSQIVGCTQSIDQITQMPVGTQTVRLTSTVRPTITPIPKQSKINYIITASQLIGTKYLYEKYFGSISSNNSDVIETAFRQIDNGIRVKNINEFELKEVQQEWQVVYTGTEIKIDGSDVTLFQIGNCNTLEECSNEGFHEYLVKCKILKYPNNEPCECFEIEDSMELNQVVFLDGAVVFPDLLTSYPYLTKGTNLYSQDDVLLEFNSNGYTKTYMVYNFYAEKIAQQNACTIQMTYERK